jgi:hypothetical protein
MRHENSPDGLNSPFQQSTFPPSWVDTQDTGLLYRFALNGSTEPRGVPLLPLNPRRVHACPIDPPEET